MSSCVVCSSRQKPLQAAVDEQAGFTLLEILIALAIFALLSTAVLSQSRHSENAAARVADKQTALQIASNAVEAVQLDGTFPAPGHRQQTLEQNGRSWLLDTQISNSGRSDMRKIRVSVYDAAQQAGQGPSERVPLASLLAYKGRY